MKRKLLINAMQPLICKKRSKKRKIIIYEYENNISNLMRKLKIEDKDNESSSSDETMPPNIRAFESSMRNKLLRCNLKTYSSYSSSKNINVYKKAESKCIRFISISTYLQGKVFSTPNSAKLAIRRFSPYYGIKNKSIVTAPKPLLNITNAFSLKQFDSLLTHGKFGSVLNLNVKCTDVIKNINFDSTQSFMYENEFKLSIRHLKNFSPRKQFNELLIPEYIMPFANIFLNGGRIFHNERSSPYSSRLELVPNSNMNRSSDNFGKDCKSVETNVENISNHDTGDEKYESGTLNINMDRIKQTIIELMHLGLEIEKYVSVFKRFNHVSPSIHGISKLKKKFADLVIEYKYLQAKKFKLNTEECFKNTFLRKKIKIEKPNDSYGESEALNVLKKNVNIPYNSLRKRSCKRSKKDKEENALILKRSKILDECISRVKVENFYVKRENISAMSSESIKGNNVQQVSEDKNRDVGKMFNVISDFNSLAESMKTGLSSVDTSNGEIHQTSLKLPSFHETFKDIQKINGRYPESGNSSDTIYYDMDDGRKMVISPYINIY